MVAPSTREGRLSEQRKDRQFNPEQKAEIVLAGLRGDRSVREVCREYQIAETLYYQWRERLPVGGRRRWRTHARRPPSRPRSSSFGNGSASSSGP
jgi:transposase